MILENLLTTENVVFTGVNILLAWSVYLTLMTGTLSFAMAAFMGMGAYSAGVLTANFGWPLAAAAVVAMVACFAVGVLVGIPALRVRGLYLMLMTTGVTFAAQSSFEHIEYIGAVSGMGGLVGTTQTIVLASLVVVGGLLWLLSRTPLQRILDAVREDEHVAGSLGINIVFVRVAGFSIGAALAGYAGVLWGHYMYFIAPENFDILTSVFIALFVILGGVNNLWGPAFGAAFITLVPEIARELGQDFASARQLIFSAGIVLLLLVRSEGVLAFRTLTIKASEPARSPRLGHQENRREHRGDD